MNRRKFIRIITRFGFLAGTASILYPVSKLMDVLKTEKKPALPVVDNDMTDVKTGKGAAQRAGLLKNVKNPGLKRV